MNLKIINFINRSELNMSKIIGIDLEQTKLW